jgi:hypothetical protein
MKDIGTGGRLNIWIPAPRFREDKLRGNDEDEMRNTNYFLQ